MWQPLFVDIGGQPDSPEAVDSEPGLLFAHCAVTLTAAPASRRLFLSLSVVSKFQKFKNIFGNASAVFLVERVGIRFESCRLCR